MHCLDCGYALDGLTEHRCPECGRAFDPADEKTWRPWYEIDARGKRQAPWRKPVLIGLLVFVLFIAIDWLTPGSASPWLSWLVVAVWIIVPLMLVIRFDARRLLRRYNQREAMLGEWRFGEVAAIHRRMLASWRPATLYWRCFWSGMMEHMYAVDLFQMHRLEAALAWSQRAAERVRRRATFRDSVLRMRAIVLIKLGRADDERVVSLLEDGERDGAQADLRAWVALNEGRVNEAAALAVNGWEKAPAIEADALRINGACALLAAGRFDEALSLLDAPPADALALFAPKQREQASRTKQGRGHVEQIRQSYAGTITRMLHVNTARVHLERGDAVAMRAQLDAAVATRDHTPELALHLELLHAGCAALEQNSADVAQHLAAARKLTDRLKSRIAGFFWHAMAGECRVLLGEPAAALGPFEQALTLATHPIERHEIRYRLARACEAVGDVTTAQQLDQAVVADGFATRWSRDAATRLAAEA